MKIYSEKGSTYTKVTFATKDIKYILGPMRLPFLILTPACLLLGIGTAFWTGANIDQLSLVLIVIAGISAHISVNTFNEYFDFKSGLDFRTKRSPFSGGSGTNPTTDTTHTTSNYFVVDHDAGDRLADITIRKGVQQ